MRSETVQKLGVSGGAAERPAGPPLGGDMVLGEGAVRNGGADLDHQVRAPLGDQRICWLAPIRRCSNHCTVLSVVAVEIGSPLHRAFA